MTSRARSAVLGFAVAADLFTISTVPRRSGGPPTPRLIGLSSAEAAAAARRHHFSVYFDGGAIDRAARFGAVVFQSLPAGLPDNGPGRQVDVIIAVQKSPPCQARQLALSYLGGQPGAGNDFGTLLISDHAQRACALHGPLRVAGLDRAGRRVTSTVGFPLTGVTVLSPGVGAISHAGPEGGLTGLAPGDLAGMIVLQAEYRDGPAKVDSGLCMPDWVVPASWRVTLPDSTSLSVANVDRRDPSLVPSGGFVTCRGRLGGIVPATVGSPGS